MSFQAMTWAVEQDLKTNDKMVLVMLSNCCNHHTGQCNPSHKRLAKECGMSVSTLKRCISNLEELGYLKIETREQEGVNLPNQYHLNIGFIPGSNRTNPVQNEQGSVHSEPRVGSERTEGSVHSEPRVGSERATKQEYNQEYNQEDKLSEAGKPASSENSNLPAVVSNEPPPPNNETIFQSKCKTAWEMYSSAYQNRYNIKPVRNAKVNSQIRALVKRLGEESGLVADFFVNQVNDHGVVHKCHDIGILLHNAESYRTQWATGRSMTQTRARQIDSTQANMSAADEAKAMLYAREQQQGAYQ